MPPYNRKMKYSDKIMLQDKSNVIISSISVDNQFVDSSVNFNLQHHMQILCSSSDN